MKTKKTFKLSATEKRRLFKLTAYERAAYEQGYQSIVGIDEAGRGPLAGPVVAAACMIAEGHMIPHVDDSKKLEPKLRRTLFERLIIDPKVVFAVGIIDSTEIDRVNIYQATILAMLQALEKLSLEPDYLLVDGLKLPHPNLPCQKIIKGDQLSQSIAAASVIAKETRDDLMRKFHETWNEYGFDQHKGYSTPQHLKAIQKFGLCPIHRRSFNIQR